MNVLLNVKVARKPGKTVPVAKLKFQVGPLGLARKFLKRLREIGGFDGDDFSDRAFRELGERGPHAGVVPPAETGDDCQVFLLRQFAGGEHRAHTRSVDGHRLFDKGMLPLFDGILQMGRPEMRRRRQDDHIHTAVDDLLVGVETDEFVVAADGHFVADVGTLEGRQA